MAFGLVVTFTMIASPLQYVAVALKRPLADAWLSAADLAVGIHVGSIVEWTAARPGLARLLVFSYGSLLPQFFLPFVILAFWYRDRAALWEYVFHFHFCALVTIVSLAIWPAACAFTYYGVESLLNQERFVRHLTGLRAGTMYVVDADDLEGLVSMPSFHMAGALMITWAFRRYPVWLVLLVPLNLLMMASTVMTGAHYFVDVLATVALFSVSLWLYSRSGLSKWHLA
jgi:membrane-associated phospholipid phosphatase